MNGMISVLLLGILIYYFGFSVVVRRYPLFAKWVGQIVSAIRKQLLRFWRWAWQNYRQGIIGFILGVFFALWATGRL